MDIFDRVLARMMASRLAMQRWQPKGNKFRPHQGKKERERRLRLATSGGQRLASGDQELGLPVSDGPSQPETTLQEAQRRAIEAGCDILLVDPNEPRS